MGITTKAVIRLLRIGALWVASSVTPKVRLVSDMFRAEHQITVLTVQASHHMSIRNMEFRFRIQRRNNPHMALRSGDRRLRPVILCFLTLTADTTILLTLGFISAAANLSTRRRLVLTLSR